MVQLLAIFMSHTLKEKSSKSMHPVVRNQVNSGPERPKTISIFQAPLPLRNEISPVYRGFQLISLRQNESETSFFLEIVENAILSELYHDLWNRSPVNSAELGVESI